MIRIFLSILMSLMLFACSDANNDIPKETANAKEEIPPTTPSASPDLGNQAHAVSPPPSEAYTEAMFQEDIDNLRDRPSMSTDQEGHIREINSKLVSIKNIRDRAYKYGKNVDVFEAVLNCALNYQRDDEVSLRIACISLMGGFSNTFLKLRDVESLLQNTLKSDFPHIRAVTYWFLRQKDYLMTIPEVRNIAVSILERIKRNDPTLSPFDEVVISLLFRVDEVDTLRDALSNKYTDMLRVIVSLDKAGDEDFVMSQIGSILNKKRPLSDKEYDFLCNLSRVKTDLRVDQFLKEDFMKLSVNLPEKDRQWFEAYCSNNNPYMVIRGLYDF